jgi:hypothetical protein
MIIEVLSTGLTLALALIYLYYVLKGINDWIMNRK